MDYKKKSREGACGYFARRARLVHRAMELRVPSIDNMTYAQLQAAIICEDYDIDDDKESAFCMRLARILSLSSGEMREETGWTGDKRARKEDMIRDYMLREAHKYQRPRDYYEKIEDDNRTRAAPTVSTHRHEIDRPDAYGAPEKTASESLGEDSDDEGDGDEVNDSANWELLPTSAPMVLETPGHGENGETPGLARQQLVRTQGAVSPPRRRPENDKDIVRDSSCPANDGVPDPTKASDGRDRIFDDPIPVKRTLPWNMVKAGQGSTNAKLASKDMVSLRNNTGRKSEASSTRSRAPMQTATNNEPSVYPRPLKRKLEYGEKDDEEVVLLGARVKREADDRDVVPLRQAGRQLLEYITQYEQLSQAERAEYRTDVELRNTAIVWVMAQKRELPLVAHEAKR